MKHSEAITSPKTRGILPALLAWGVPWLLAIPSIALSVQGGMSLACSLAQILLPMGVLLLLMCSFRRVGVTALCMIPLMVLAAFQIVLLFLYGDGSIIGVDMFLNVATTNSSEALELLDNLLPAIMVVIALYLPAIIMAIVAVRRRAVLVPSQQRPALHAGGVLTLTGMVALAVSIITQPNYRMDEDFYPVNVIGNLAAAFNRAYKTGNYASSSSDYRFDAVSSRPADEREVYIAVIGETSRADNWQLFGYNRFTTPHLCAMADSTLAAFGHTLSESNTTHKSVPLLLSALTAENFGRDINSTKSVITAFNEAGFKTDFISMQARNGSYIDFFGGEAGTSSYLREPQPGVVDHSKTDLDIIPAVDSLISSGSGKQLIVVHLYGSHFNYSDRYPRADAYFIPDLASEANLANRARLMNAYDNSIRQTDAVLASLIAKLEAAGCSGGLIFTSDHGEDIYDDSRHRFLHASPTPTFMQLHVPMIVYLTEELRKEHPELWHAAKANEHLYVSSSASFTPTLISMAGIDSPKIDPGKALTNESYRPPEQPVFLNDRNRAETLDEAGFTHIDFEQLRAIKETFMAQKLNNSEIFH